MNYNLEIQRIILEIDKVPDFSDKVHLLKQAIQLADANNDIDWGIDLRLDLIHYEGFTSRLENSIPTFAWILSIYDSDPDVLDVSTVLIRYKWMLQAIFDHPGISRQQIENIFTDYQQRLVNAGYGRRSYYDAKIGWMLFIGNIDMARQYTVFRNAEPVDAMSSDNEMMTDICVELLDSNFDKALVLSKELLQQDSFDERPIYCMLVYYLTLAGDNRADEYFEKAEKALSENDKYPYMLFDVSQLMYYLSKNNQEKAWMYFEKYAHWEFEVNEYFSFDFSLSLLPLLEDEGSRNLSLSTKFPFYKESGVYDIKELYQYYSEKVNTFGSKFDERNGTDYFQKQIKRHLRIE